MMPSMLDPICAFVSVETEEAYNELCKEPLIDLAGTDTLINVDPVEPTNIAWENFDFDNSTRNKRFFIIIGTIVFVLLVTFFGTLKAAAT